MATSPANSTNLTQDQLAKWLIEDAPYKIQIARVWPFMGIQGGKISYARTAALESLANIDDMATILGDGATSGITVQTADPDTPPTRPSHLENWRHATNSTTLQWIVSRFPTIWMR
ncbi:MAG: hypothetical protein R3E76_07850 [Planctomycetota bacterium]